MSYRGGAMTIGLLTRILWYSRTRGGESRPFNMRASDASLLLARPLGEPSGFLQGVLGRVRGRVRGHGGISSLAIARSGVRLRSGSISSVSVGRGDWLSGTHRTTCRGKRIDFAPGHLIALCCSSSSFCNFLGWWRLHSRLLLRSLL